MSVGYIELDKEMKICLIKYKEQDKGSSPYNLPWGLILGEAML